MRLDKYLADMGIGTRKEIKKLILAGLVTVDDEIITKPDHKVDESSSVCLEGEPLIYQQYQYFLLNKPAGYLCTKDGSPNVMELVPNYYKDLNPVGRLDKDTEGLLIITNDGHLTHQLISPKYHVDKKYYFECDKPLPADAAAVLSKPIEFSDFISLPGKLELISENSGYLTIHEGKFHQVRRMIGYLGCNVTYLKRTNYSFLDIEDLAVGEYRELTAEETEKLKGVSDNE
ncbi:MAG: rRNA pseudouridine synthase [Erysipelotrichaceae bacterium]|nr:rRNA pseudouridine synthase [Erysipelotrichaceae bacterium]